MLIAALSTDHKVGLIVLAAILIGFSLFSSFAAPRRAPDFPGNKLNVFIVVSLVLFVAMLAAVEIFGVENREANAGVSTAAAPKKGTLDAVESEWKIQLPATGTLTGGAFTFHVVNMGKMPHNLTVEGPGVANAHTPLLKPGASADLRVTLETGSYDVYCSVPGHKQLGMDAKLSVG